jgi:hypothetical protein
MKIFLFAGAAELDWIEAKVIDASMGVIGGNLHPTLVYFISTL